MQECELVVLEALKWNVSRITPHDVLDHILVRLPFSVEQRHVVRRHAVTLIVLCVTGQSPNRHIGLHSST